MKLSSVPCLPVPPVSLLHSVPSCRCLLLIYYFYKQTKVYVGHASLVQMYNRTDIQAVCALSKCMHQGSQIFSTKGPFPVHAVGISSVSFRPLPISIGD